MGGGAPGSYESEWSMISSANELWGAIFAATSVYPEILPSLYEKISPTRRDGYNEGSMREVTYGRDFKKLVSTAEEQLTEVDHDQMRVCCTVEAGEFKSKHYRSFKTVTTVTPRAKDGDRMAPGCTVKWKCNFVDARGTVSTDAVLAFMKKTFQGLDEHLQDLMTNP